jgi:hypothetical protein
VLILNLIILPEREREIYHRDAHRDVMYFVTDGLQFHLENAPSEPYTSFESLISS